MFPDWPFGHLLLSPLRFSVEILLQLQGRLCRNFATLVSIVCLFVPLIGSLYSATFALEWEICGISSIRCSTEASELDSLLTILLETVVYSRVGESLHLEHCLLFAIFWHGYGDASGERQFSFTYATNMLALRPQWAY